MSILLRIVQHHEHRPVAVPLRGEKTFRTGVCLLAQDSQPVSPTETMQLTVVAGNVDGDQQEWLLFLLASVADDFQGVRFPANSMPRGRVRGARISRSVAPSQRSRRGWNVSLGYPILQALRPEGPAQYMSRHYSGCTRCVGGGGKLRSEPGAASLPEEEGTFPSSMASTVPAAPRRPASEAGRLPHGNEAHEGATAAGGCDGASVGYPRREPQELGEYSPRESLIIRRVRR